MSFGKHKGFRRFRLNAFIITYFMNHVHNHARYYKQTNLKYQVPCIKLCSSIRNPYFLHLKFGLGRYVIHTYGHDVWRRVIIFSRQTDERNQVNSGKLSQMKT